MIAVDTNILMCAHRADSPWHARAAERVRSLAEGKASWAIPWPCVHELVAIVTHPRIYDPPSTLGQAIDQVEAWLESPTLVLLAEADGYWPTLSEALRGACVVGPRVHDARIVALCLSHGVARLWTADRDFGRWPDLETLNPLVA